MSEKASFSDNPATLRHRAAHLRYLARSFPDDPASQTLIELAQELTAKAEDLEKSASDADTKAKD